MPPARSDRRLGFLLSELSHLLRCEFDRRVQAKRLGLTRAQWLMLRQLSFQEGCRQRELADALRFAPATVARQVERLAAAGWLDRRPDPCDRRARRLHLQPRARRTLAELQRMVTRFRAEYFADLPAARRIQLIDDLLVIRRNLLARRARAGGRPLRHASHAHLQAAR